MDFLNVYLDAEIIVGICPSLVAPANGKIHFYGRSPGGNGQYHVNTLAYFRCNSGYSRVGYAWRKCQASGNWNGKTPKCSKENHLSLFLSYFWHYHLKPLNFITIRAYEYTAGYIIWKTPRIKKKLEIPNSLIILILKTYSTGAVRHC